MKWGHRRNFKDGKVYYHYASFLGYRKGPDGLPEIDPDEAAIVRRIFSRYLLGQSVHQICRDLMSDGVKTAQGSDSWHDSVVRKMLQNRLLAKLGKAVKIADTSNQGKAKSKAASTVAVTLREDTKPFDKTDCVFNKDPFS